MQSVRAPPGSAREPVHTRAEGLSGQGMHAGGENLLRGLEVVKGRHLTVFRRDEPRRSHLPHLRLWDPSPAKGCEGGRRQDAGPVGEGLHREVGGAPLNEHHPGVVEEVLDLHPPAGGEVIDDGDVAITW